MNEKDVLQLMEDLVTTLPDELELASFAADVCTEFEKKHNVQIERASYSNRVFSICISGKWYSFRVTLEAIG